MSQENVEIARQIYDAAAEGKLASSLQFFDPEVTYNRPRPEDGAAPDMTLEAQGIEAFVRASYEWVQTFERLTVDATQFIDAGDAVVIFTRHKGNAKVSGVPIQLDIIDVLRFRDGLVVHMTQCFDKAEALRVAGLRE